MTAPEAAVWCQSPLLLAAVLPSGALAGLLLARGVGRLLPPPPPGAPKTGRWPLAARVAPAVMAAATAAVWWWEIRMLGQIPAAVAGVDCVVLWLRLAAHLILASLLAAAAWVDLEERVIPDAITVPGVLAGLAWNALLPATLLPVGRTVSRSFAPPLIEPDVLGGFGPLHDVGLPGWLCGPAGLALMAAIFAVWWWFGMPPARPDGRPDAPADPRLIRLGLIVAAAGGFGLTIAWLAGGDHWAGLVTALLGLLVAAGIIWATRAGASRALGREAMGFGDVTLMAMAGSWLAGLPAGLPAGGLHRPDPRRHATAPPLRVGAALRPEPLPGAGVGRHRLATDLDSLGPAVRAAPRNGAGRRRRDRDDSPHALGMVPAAGWLSGLIRARAAALPARRRFPTIPPP
jgi:prepilin signal peptidase PulO-like enzyme (type II secretory pathway)